MIEQNEFFNRAMCFTPIWGIVALLFIVHFFVSWYRSFRKTGWKIDFWFLTLSLSIFPSIFLLYPFNASINNFFFTRGFHEKILPFVDQAFAISILGYLCIWVGRYLFDFSHRKFPLSAIFLLASPLYRLVENNIKSKRGYFWVVCTSMLLGCFILYIQFDQGCFFNARGWFLKQPALRPVFNLAVSIIPIAFIFLTLRYIQFKEKHCLKWIFILLAISLFFGVRSLALGGLFTLISYQIFYREGQFSFIKLIGIFLALFFTAVILGNLREGQFDPMSSIHHFVVQLVYGNNFSDTRDFAWILAFWDGEYLYGKTYLAALASFIPRALSSMREEWSISMYTNAITGFDAEIMPGLRPGVFGEAFLNFSYIGVILFGIIFGFSLRYADFKIKECVTKSKDIIKGYSHLILFSLISCLSISASMWSFYVFLLLNLILVLFRGSLREQPRHLIQT